MGKMSLMGGHAAQHQAVLTDQQYNLVGGLFRTMVHVRTDQKGPAELRSIRSTP